MKKKCATCKYSEVYFCMHPANPTVTETIDEGYAFSQTCKDYNLYKRSVFKTVKLPITSIFFITSLAGTVLDVKIIPYAIVVVMFMGMLLLVSLVVMFIKGDNERRKNNEITVKAEIMSRNGEYMGDEEWVNVEEVGNDK